jgi:hypothetical protein
LSATRAGRQERGGAQLPLIMMRESDCIIRRHAARTIIALDSP